MSKNFDARTTRLVQDKIDPDFKVLVSLFDEPVYHKEESERCFAGFCMSHGYNTYTFGQPRTDWRIEQFEESTGTWVIELNEGDKF